MKLAAAGCCAWCGGVLRSTKERTALRCWLCARLDGWRWRWNEPKHPMPDDTYRNNTRADLRDLVEQLRPADALEIIKKLRRTDDDQQRASMLAELIRGFVDRRDDKRRQDGAQSAHRRSA